MEPLLIKPEKEQRTLWFVAWWIWLTIGLVPGLVLSFLLDSPGNLIAALSTLGWLLVCGPFALWIPAFYRSLEYVIDSDAVKGKKGVFWRSRVTVPYAKITNIDVTQGPVQRMFDLGTIHVQTAGAGGTQGTVAELRLRGIRDLDMLRETIMERLKAYTSSRPEQFAQQPPVDANSALFKRMVEELSAIRSLLEKRP